MSEIDDQYNLVKHAKRELEIVGEDENVKKATLEIVSIFSSLGHSGSSAEFHIQMLERLLRFKNLSPITNDRDEWEAHDESVWGAEGGVYQNRRNGEAFSTDGGKTYYLLSDPRDKVTGLRKMYTSEEKK